MGDHKTREIFSGSAIADGDWFFVGDSSYKSLHFRLLEKNGQIEIRASNKETIPGASDQESTLFEPFTSGEVGGHGIFEIHQLVTWLRFRKLAIGALPEVTEALLREGIIT